MYFARKRILTEDFTTCYGRLNFFLFNRNNALQVWSHKEFPLIPVGKIVLNKNSSNYFAEVEQSAFAPSHVVPGIEFSPDKMLQGRLFAYPDTQFHRLGPNYVQLPINCPYRARAHNTQRGMPSYHPNSFNGALERADVKESAWSVSGDVERFNAEDEDNFSQPRELWLKVLDESARGRLVDNIVESLKYCKPFIQERAVKNFAQVHEDFGNALRKALQKANDAVQKKREEETEFSAKESVMMPCAVNPHMKNISNLSKHCKY
ncbi:unnamed protein product [Toxocara canis]|uniref:Catalase domain-containing protein n=1 Tax=Toxocara canis TaxID=6265 RepID=A0A183VDS8_TOXCA|nr:unnamed protein product [Toxocara canis]